MSHNVLVTGVGGVVGQGILRNIAACSYDIRLVGTNTGRVSAGNHLCDQVYDVPFSYEEGYLEQIRTICRDENIDLIIPATDYEVYYLATAQDTLPPVAGSPAETAKIFLDKYLTWLELEKRGIPFAESSLPSAYGGEFSECIVKPREGRGSRGIHFNPENPGAFSDDNVVQRLHHGIEITTGFYVTAERQLLGHITLERTLSSGATNSCSVSFKHNDEIERIITHIVEAFEIRGSCNIQSIVTSDNRIIPFEINCRISGTNSIRSQFGFTDVKYTIDEHLYHKPLTRPRISKGSAVRILLDVIYPDISLDDVQNKNTPHYLY